jgi:5'-3' exonuclease
LDSKGEVRGHGRKFLYFQVLSGDSSDNYKANSASKKKWGAKSAYALLKDCKNDKECFEALVNGYMTLYPEPSRVIGWRGYEDPATLEVLKPNADDFAIDIDWLYVMQENFTMAHMLRWDGDKFEVKPLLEKLGVAH